MNQEIVVKVKKLYSKDISKYEMMISPHPSDTAIVWTQMGKSSF